MILQADRDFYTLPLNSTVVLISWVTRDLYSLLLFFFMKLSGFQCFVNVYIEVDHDFYTLIKFRWYGLDFYDLVRSSRVDSVM
jgi:hypothetical protein